ncbi:putative flagellar hook-length control protein FliK [Pseudomonas saudimassiliensis]|uniref:Putative flagellar hook-length control protein FliK n=1 Tax=Pseudomonas saudimassiliensis TaxID=1461581 RepID=A0A078MIG1_9PSED|nr:flagellar hook-length control protein FliK [Pseudomonas saudimassiliensis]CEA06049.1 putative flagellar hook-length control protein FliK [Pseudomonas saudimassiliensis]CEF27474.1 putative flagellar hook-length control protein FliK [Pseudomonas saudimassiliensis]
MSASPPLMALLNTDLRPSARSDSARTTPDAEQGDAFAGLLAEQLPDDLAAALDDLSAEQRAALEQAALAADGKGLPPLQEWLEQLPLEQDELLPGGEDALSAIGQWLQLLQDAAKPVTSGQPGAATLAAGGAATPAAGSALGASQTGLPMDGVDSLELTAGQAGREQTGREQSDRQQTGRDPLLDNDLNRPTRQGAQTQTNQAQDFSAALQRVAASAAESQPVSAAMLGKLAEQLERGSASRSGGETEALDGARPGSYAATARPVAAPTQALGVPFGQPSWGEAMIEKVMWMSSQNLRSVEIQLDPAELGPLEIHIQHRGQELQVQFVSQNPSVREALEAQMHRLRDMFGQQGLEQAEVTVADRSAGDQPGQREGQAPERTAGRAAPGASPVSGAASGEPGEPSTSRAQWLPTQRLVDYYV